MVQLIRRQSEFRKFVLFVATLVLLLPIIVCGLWNLTNIRDMRRITEASTIPFEQVTQGTLDLAAQECDSFRAGDTVTIAPPARGKLTRIFGDPRWKVAEVLLDNLSGEAFHGCQIRLVEPVHGVDTLPAYFLRIVETAEQNGCERFRPGMTVGPAEWALNDEVLSARGWNRESVYTVVSLEEFVPQPKGDGLLCRVEVNPSTGSSFLGGQLVPVLPQR